MSTRAVPKRAFPPTQTDGTIDLRRHRRYPIALDIQYKWSISRLEQMGSGTTLNISSGGVLFRSTRPLPTRCSVEMALTWPFSLNDCALKLVMKGRVVRSDDRSTAVQVTHYEFRTAGPLRDPTA
jgi:c-di-GMP-binding flagellar brake protein YcgR